MSKCSDNAKPVADVLSNVNNALGGKVWTDEEISSVSNKIACNLIGDLKEILNIAVIKPLTRRPDIELAYTNNNVKDLGPTYGFKLTGLPQVNTITFETLFVDPNVEQGIKNQHFLERIHLVNLDVTKNTAADHLTAEADYTEDSTSTVSSSDYAYYLVTGANGIFDGAKRVKIVFNKDKTRNVSVMF
jgi:hypothetical protein